MSSPRQRARPTEPDGSPGAPAILLVLGVSGSGKSTVGSMLADRLGLPFTDADDFHTRQHRERMAAGTPLTDAERWPWLARIARWMDEQILAGTSAVIACSALKRSYRDFLREARPAVRLLYLNGGRELIAERLAARTGHFFPARLLESQFHELEVPAADELPYVVPLTGSVEQIVDAALGLLGPIASRSGLTPPDRSSPYPPA